MAIPLLIGIGVALAGAGLGAGAMISASEKREEAENLYSKKKRQLKSAGNELEKHQEKTTAVSESLGLLKLNLQQNEIANFLDIYSKIAKLNIKGFKDTEIKFGFTKTEIKSMNIMVMNASEVLGTGVQSLAGGVLAGAGVYSSVITLGAASTGTAITSLSGVAATNATMAWLGGGSLAAGGMGMAGGAVALGGFVAGPALLIMGAIADSKADEALTEAYSYASEVDIACEEMKSQTVLLQSIAVRCREFLTVLTELQDRLSTQLEECQTILDNTGHRKDITEADEQVFYTTFLLAKSLKDVMNTGVINTDGELNPEGQDIENKVLLPS